MVRGYPRHDPYRCIGCGACSNVCPTDSITVRASGDKIEWIHNIARCIRCCFCVDYCPTGALSVGEDYSMIADSVEKLYILHTIDVEKCPKCGRAMAYSVNVEKHVTSRTEKASMSCEKCKIENLLRVVEKVRRI